MSARRKKTNNKRTGQEYADQDVDGKHASGLKTSSPGMAGAPKEQKEPAVPDYDIDTGTVQGAGERFFSSAQVADAMRLLAQASQDVRGRPKVTDNFSACPTSAGTAAGLGASLQSILESSAVGLGNVTTGYVNQLQPDIDEREDLVSDHDHDQGVLELVKELREKQGFGLGKDREVDVPASILRSTLRIRSVYGNLMQSVRLHDWRHGYNRQHALGWAQAVDQAIPLGDIPHLKFLVQRLAALREADRSDDWEVADSIMGPEPGSSLLDLECAIQINRVTALRRKATAKSRQGCEGRVTAHHARMRLNKRIRSHRRAKRSESNSALNAAKAAFSALQYLEDRVPPQEFDMDFDNDSFIFPSSYPSSLIDLQSRAWLPAHINQLLEDPSTSAVTEGHVLDISGEHPSNEAPSPFICGPRVEYIKLLTHMLDIGMVELRHFSADIVQNGFFTVSRPDGGQRAILAAVPANCCHRTPPNPRLPGPDVVAALRVPLGATLHVACLDLPKVYDELRVPDWLSKYFVFLGQEFHVELIRRSCPSFGQPLMPGERRSVNNNDTVPSVYIDDLRIFTLDSTLGNTALQCYEQAVEERKGLRCNSEKRSPSLPTNQVMGHSLRNNIYKPDPLKLTKLMEKTTSVCSHGATSGRMIQRLVEC
eukprot:g38760.t1